MAFRVGLADKDLVGVGQPADEALALPEDLALVRDDVERTLLRRRHVHLRAAVADSADGVHDRFHVRGLDRELKALVILRPVGQHEELALVRDGLPDLLGDERHERMQQPQELIEHIDQHLLRGQLALLVLAVQACLGQLDIPVAVGIPDEVIDLGRGHAKLVSVHILGDFPDERIELGQHPLVLDLKISSVGQAGLFDVQVHEDIAARVPDLIGKVAHGLALFHVEAHVVAW